MVNKDGQDGIETDHPVVDPTKNVLDLVKAESKYQDGMRNALGEMRTMALDSESKLQTFARESESRMQNFAREAESKMQTSMREAETNRIDQLSTLRQTYEARIADMLSESVKSTSSLVSTQLVQIQSTFDARVSKLEEFRLLSTGRSSVADPALASSLHTLGNNIDSMQTTFAKALSDLISNQTTAMNKMAASISILQESGDTGSGKQAGRREVVAWIVASGMFVAAIIYPLFQILHVAAK